MRCIVDNLAGLKLPTCPTRLQIFDWNNNLKLSYNILLMTLSLYSSLMNFFIQQSRLAVNSVTFGNYKRPASIATFLSELDSAFRLLNLKNDSLRKKFDGLKYDLKKVEEVVYDLSIRGLSCESK